MKPSFTHTVIGPDTYVDLSSFSSISSFVRENPEFILNSLCRIPRFVGAGNRFYSVAQHSVLVAELAGEAVTPRQARVEMKLHAFLHDAHEAFLGDIPHPVVELLTFGLPEFKEHLADVKEDFQSAIYHGLGLPAPSPDILSAIALADKQALAREATILFLTEARTWPQMDGIPFPHRAADFNWLFSLNTTRKRGRKAIFTYYSDLLAAHQP